MSRASHSILNPKQTKLFQTVETFPAHTLPSLFHSSRQCSRSPPSYLQTRVFNFNQTKHILSIEILNCRCSAVDIRVLIPRNCRSLQSLRRQVHSYSYSQLFGSPAFQFSQPRGFPEDIHTNCPSSPWSVPLVQKCS